ncbi:MAG: hypothetical protein JWO51_2452 [Rhodospirillales bacterium]|nr:hypothetical protein [Rhodospirillales bacterium]
MEALRVKAALLARKTKLSPPVSQAELANLANVGEAKLDRYISDLYSTFNGFEGCDQKSQISLWSTDRVVQEKSLKSKVDEKIYAAFGDLLIDSDFIMWCPCDASMPVYLLYERRELAKSVSDFLEKLTSGAFDLIE